MSDFDVLCRVLEEMDPDTYNDLLVRKSARVVRDLSGFTRDGADAVTLFADFILCAVALDGRLAEEEYVLAKPILDMILESDVSYEGALEFFDGAGLGDPEGYKDTMDAVADLLGEVSPDLKDDIVMVCMLVCAVDGSISERERAWIRQLIE